MCRGLMFHLQVVQPVDYVHISTRVPRENSFEYNLGIVLGNKVLIVDFQFDVLELQVSAWK